MPKYRRRAEWIWRERQFGRGSSEEEMRAMFAAEANRYVYFRKAFSVEGDVQEANVDVSADGRYQLFVNGRLVGRGPARCSPAWQYYDPHDIKPYLRPGRNVIAALVHSYGRNMAWYELPQWQHASTFGCGGWFLQGSVVTSAGKTRLDTDNSWRYLLSEAWKQDTPWGQVGFAEEYDARLAPPGWQEPGFDDESWSHAQVLRQRGWWGSDDIVPFPVMVKRDIPYLPEEGHQPVAVVRCGEVENVAGAASIAQAMQQEEILPLEACVVEDPHAMLDEVGEATIRTAGNRSATVTIDFGKTETGRIRFEVEGPAGAIVDLAYSERVEPDGRIMVLPWGGYIHAHRVILGDGPLAWEQFEYAGFRYLQLTFRHCERPLRVRSVAVSSTSYPVGDRGRFECSDELLTRAYAISRYTLQCCMHDSYEDCPSREQRQWTNDQYVHLSANYVMFGDPLLARKLLVQVAQSQRPDGQVMMCAPGDFAATNAFNMPEFTLHWIMSIPQYVRYTGDTSVIRELYHTVAKGLEWFERHLDGDDLLSELPDVLWLDWAEVDKKGQATEPNARFAGCLRIAAGMARRLGYRDDAERYTQLGDRVAAAVNRYLWDEERGVYVDSRRGGVQSRRVSQESNTAAMFFGVAPKERWPRILDYVLDEERLVVTPVSIDAEHYHPQWRGLDEENQVVLQHGYYMHFLHAVLAELRLGQDILDSIRRHWGPQVEAGVSTWWEGWELTPALTLCHAFMCTPGFDLPSYVLGVRPLADGFARFQVAPLPGDLAWACGVFPGPRGDVPVSWRWDGSRFELEMAVPAGAQGELIAPPVVGRVLDRAEVDGRMAGGGAICVGSGAHRLVAHYRDL